MVSIRATFKIRVRVVVRDKKTVLEWYLGLGAVLSINTMEGNKWKSFLFMQLWCFYLHLKYVF